MTRNLGLRIDHRCPMMLGGARVGGQKVARNSSEGGFSLIELLFVISIVGIMAAIAIPIYRAHVTNAKLTDVTNAMSHIATSLIKYRQEDPANTWPNCGSITDIQTSLGLALAALDRIGAASVDQITGAISVTVVNIDSTVDGRTLTLVPSTATDGSILWNWGGTLPPKFIPKR